MSTQTLRQTLFRTFLPLLINCALVLTISLLAILLLQRSTSTIVTERIPVSELAAEFVLSLDNCIGELKKWVLTGEPASRTLNDSCDDKLAGKLTELDRMSPNPDNNIIATTRFNLAKLQRSVWYVVNVAHAPGNNPARHMYERDIVPVYHKIQSALTGVGSVGGSAADIELIVAITHQTLSEAVRRLSDALSSREIFEIKEFREQSARIEHMLARLGTETSRDPDRAELLNWLNREYSVYKSLAERSLDLRHSADWNRALYVLQTETEPLAQSMRSDMDHLKISTARALREAAQQSATLTTVVVVGLLLSIGVLAMLALRSSTRIARKFDEKISALSHAAGLIGKREFIPVRLSDDSPIELTSLAADINHSASTIDSRTKGLNQVIAGLKTYSQIISHDIKTPVISMRGNLSDLRETLTEQRTHSESTRFTAQELSDVRTSLGFF